MKTGLCRCGNRMFYDNHRCLVCDSSLGLCDRCQAPASFTEKGGNFRCDSCHREVYPCFNQSYGVCLSYTGGDGELCHWCGFTSVIPDTSQARAIKRWKIAESAKRRVLIELNDLDLPPYISNLQQKHPLSFQFLDDICGSGMEGPRVLTGHDQGVITLNLAEADSVHRERTRLQFGEPQRTVIGHMRHEVGHYIEWSWASRIAGEEMQQLFGDPAAVDYSSAMERYYRQGPPEDWADRYVSQYASMHPWEDFAETVNVYLDIMAIAATSNELGRSRIDRTPDAEASQLIAAVLKIVVEVSEYNADLGLTPLLPERLSPAAMTKLEFVHSLRKRVRDKCGQEY